MRIRNYANYIMDNKSCAHLRKPCFYNLHTRKVDCYEMCELTALVNFKEL